MPRSTFRVALIGAAIAAALTPTLIRSQPGGAGRADLALVPPDAVAFAHIRAADLWRTEPFKELRELVDRAGPKAMETYNRRFVVNPGIIDRVTLFVMPGPADAPQRMPPPLFIVTTTKPVDTAKLIATYMQGAKAETIGDAAVFTDHDRDMTLYPINPQTFILSTPEAAKAFAARKKTDDGPLKAALAGADSKHFTLALNASAIPPQAIDHAPPAFQPLLKAKLATVTINVGTEIAVEARLRYADDGAATDAEKAARAALQMARGQLQEAKKQVGRALLEPNTPSPAPLSEMPEALGSLFGLAVMETYDELLAKFPLNRDGSQLVAQVKAPVHTIPTVPLAAAVAAGGWMFVRQEVRMAAPAAVAVPGVPFAPPVDEPPPPPAPRAVVGGLFESKEGRAMNNMKQIGLALHNYESANGNLAGHAIYSKDGKTPLLSWRVAILPYLEQDHIYRQFKLDEPWDSEHNKKLIPMISPTYLSPNGPPAAKNAGLTHIKLFVGGGAAWERKPRGGRFQDITDGTSNTIMFIEATEPVVWTKPDDIDYDPKKPLPKFGANPDSKEILFLTMDGAAHKKPRATAEAILRAVITRAGGETVEW